MRALALLVFAVACDPTLPSGGGTVDPTAGLPCAENFEDRDLPVQVDKYLWNGIEVHAFDFGCCDLWLEVYDDQCIFACAPEGGLTGQGDGVCPSFFDEATHLGTVWTR